MVDFTVLELYQACTVAGAGAGAGILTTVAGAGAGQNGTALCTKLAVIPVSFCLSPTVCICIYFLLLIFCILSSASCILSHISCLLLNLLSPNCCSISCLFYIVFSCLLYIVFSCPLYNIHILYSLVF